MIDDVQDAIPGILRGGGAKSGNHGHLGLGSLNTHINIIVISPQVAVFCDGCVVGCIVLVCTCKYVRAL